MATLRSKQKLAAVSGDTQESARDGQSQNTFVPVINEEHITQVAEEVEGRFTKKLSREGSRTESRILGALSKLDDFLLKPQVRTCSGTVPGTSQNNNSENRKPTGNRSLSDPYPEVEFSVCRASISADSDREETSHKMPGAEEPIPYCSLGSLSGKQKKARSTSQPQFRSENTPATIEADQILLALQQLVTNSNSANLNNNINRISKLPKSLATTMPTFDGESKNFQLFEDVFQKNLRNHNQLTEEKKIDYFCSLMRGDALQTFTKNHQFQQREFVRILDSNRRKRVKPQSLVTAKEKFQRLVFNSANHNLFGFLEGLQKLSKDAFRVAAQAIIEQLKDAKMPSRLRKSKN